MRNKFTREEFDEINEIFEGATQASNKDDASKYTRRLNYIGSDVCGNSKNVYSELSAAIKNASGAVRNKERAVSDANQQLMKFEIFCVDDDHVD